MRVIGTIQITLLFLATLFQTLGSRLRRGWQWLCKALLSLRSRPLTNPLGWLHRKPVDPGPVELHIGTLEQIRNDHGVSEMNEMDEDKYLLDLPNGVYGFTTSWSIRTDGSCVVGGTGVNRISLGGTPRGTCQLEIHKASDGEIYAIGYMTDIDLTRLMEAQGKGKATMLTTPKRGSSSNPAYCHPVAVPISRIRHTNDRGLRESFLYALDLELA